MLASVRRASHTIKCIFRRTSNVCSTQRESLIQYRGFPNWLNLSSSMRFACFVNSFAYMRRPCPSQRMVCNALISNVVGCCDNLLWWLNVRHMSNSPIQLRTDHDVVRFSFATSPSEKGKQVSFFLQGMKWMKKKKMSRKAKLNELRFYRLKAKKKMRSPNPEVRIRYKLEKAKRKEAWLIEKLRKFEVPKPPAEMHDPEILTEEERFYLKRTGEKKKNYVPVGRRGVFGGVVLNMHLHWKKHETVKVVCKTCKPGEVYEIAEELAQLSKGIVIDVKPNNTIIFYRGKNYVQPEVMSPPDTLSKDKALEKYRYQQSLEHTSQFVETLERELQEYHEHIAQYRKRKGNLSENSAEST